MGELAGRISDKRWNILSSIPLELSSRNQTGAGQQSRTHYILLMKVVKIYTPTPETFGQFV